jgi:hypothetical protein
MKRKLATSLIAMAAGGLGFMSLGGCVYEDGPAPPPPGVTVVAPVPGGDVVATAPPPDQVEVQPPAPGIGFVWIGGFWDWDGGHYIWRRGYWGRPGPGYHAWEHDRWVAGPHGGYVHQRGHWR